MRMFAIAAGFATLLSGCASVYFLLPWVVDNTTDADWKAIGGTPQGLAALVLLLVYWGSGYVAGRLQKGGSASHLGLLFAVIVMGLIAAANVLNVDAGRFPVPAAEGGWVALVYLLFSLGAPFAGASQGVDADDEAANEIRKRVEAEALEKAQRANWIKRSAEQREAITDTWRRPMAMLKEGLAFYSVALALLLIVHWWQLPKAIADFLPLLSLGVAYVVGGKLLAAALGFAVYRRTPFTMRCLGTPLLAALVMALLASLYVTPFYCAYRRYAAAVRDTPVALGRPIPEPAQSFAAYIRNIGRRPVPLNLADMPTGEDPSDILITVVHVVDQFSQRLVGRWTSRPVAGYASAGVWYLAFIATGVLGSQLTFYDDWKRLCRLSPDTDEYVVGG
jgi:hypothetical protein